MISRSSDGGESGINGEITGSRNAKGSTRVGSTTIGISWTRQYVRLHTVWRRDRRSQKSYSFASPRLWKPLVELQRAFITVRGSSSSVLARENQLDVACRIANDTCGTARPDCRNKTLRTRPNSARKLPEIFTVHFITRLVRKITLFGSVVLRILQLEDPTSLRLFFTINLII